MVAPRARPQQSVAALFSARNKPQIELLVDSSQQMSARLVEGLLAQYSMQHVSKEAFSGATGDKVMNDYLSDIEGEQLTPERTELKSLLQSVRRLNSLRNSEQAAKEWRCSGQWLRAGYSA